MNSLRVLIGSRSRIKKEMLSYCIERFESEQLWLLDSLQVFDPYWLSRRSTVRTRALLSSMYVSRPFTLHQLRDKLFTLTKMPLSGSSTLLISAIDSFDGDVESEEEKAALFATMLVVIRSVAWRSGCSVIIGCLSPSSAERVRMAFPEVMLWDGQ